MLVIDRIRRNHRFDILRSNLALSQEACAAMMRVVVGVKFFIEIELLRLDGMQILRETKVEWNA